MELYHLKIYIDDLLHRAVGSTGVGSTTSSFFSATLNVIEPFIKSTLLEECKLCDRIVPSSLSLSTYSIFISVIPLLFNQDFA